VLLVGLYWSFVDVVWLVLYPMIYFGGAELTMSLIKDLILSLLLLALLLGLELGMVLVPHVHSLGSLVFVPAGLMVAVVALAFMDLRQGPALVYLFVAGGLVGLLVLLGLGTMDPLTRTMYYVPEYYVPAQPNRAAEPETAKP
jgi:hypothetical protein